MATTEPYIATQTIRQRSWTISAQKSQDVSVPVGIAVASTLTLVALLIGGYHPYAEDGGVYLPGVIKFLHPDLYPAWTGFVTAQTRFSLFAPLMASLVRATGLSMMACVFLIYVASIWTTLYAAWTILARCYERFEARLAGVSILALCLTMPIAGTALILLDPYVTARSFSTPCTLLAISGAIGAISDFKQTNRTAWKSIMLVAISLLIAAIMHPLMASYAAGCLLLLACSSVANLRVRMIAFGLVACAAVAVATLLCLLAPLQPDGYAQVAQTRDYWFLSDWHWYELLGLLAPLVILFAISRMRRGDGDPKRWLAQTAVTAGVIGLIVTLAFAGKSSSTYIVAMLQPLRVFLIVYVAMVLLASAELGERLLARARWRWSLLYLVLGSLMFAVQLSTFPHSKHLEFPWNAPQNAWEAGFVWIRNNTPKDALFAIDANYIGSRAEDAQNFRAIAERSLLPDNTKDGGIAAIEPDLTAEWKYAQNIQAGLARDTDAQRRAKLAEARIDWLVLPESTVTGFSCPYKNNSMQVCSVPAQESQTAALSTGVFSAHRNRSSAESTKNFTQGSGLPSRRTKHQP